MPQKILVYFLHNPTTKIKINLNRDESELISICVWNLNNKRIKNYKTLLKIKKIFKYF